MRILWLNGRPENNPGGTEQHTVDFIKALGKVERIELFLAVAKGSFADKNTANFDRKVYVRFRSEFAPNSTFKLIREARKIKPDIIVANNGNEYLNAFLAGQLSGAEVVLFRHMVARQPYLLKKLVFPRVKYILAVSDYVKEFLLKEEGVQAKKVHVVYNFIDPEEFDFSQVRRRNIREKYGIGKNEVVLLYCGKISKGKGIREFTEVYRNLRIRHRNLKAIVVGGGDMLREIRENFRTDRNVLVTGPQNSAAEFFIASDIFLMPTRAKESFGRTIVEAFATKTAVVASNIGNIPYLIRNGVNGYLAEVGDVRSMTNLVDKLIQDGNIRKKLQEEGYKDYLTRFHRDIVLTKFLKLIGQA